jgi:hypothetical protein
MSESTCRPRIWCLYVEKKNMSCSSCATARWTGPQSDTLGAFSRYFILHTHVLCINIKDWDIKYFYFYFYF